MHSNDERSSTDLDDALERAEHYRALARELRAVAALLQSADTKAQLRATAESYDRIAESVLAMRKIDRDLQQPSHDDRHA
jgi:hypothetical protein